MTTTTTIQKFCHACGRCMSRAATSKNAETQKYCSHQCRSAKPTALDRSIEARFMTHLSGGNGGNGGDKKHGVSCDTIQNQVFGLATGGMEGAKERERVRRAGRRIIVFPELESVHHTKLECVQNGKVVEASFAKGDWSVRMAE